MEETTLFNKKYRIPSTRKPGWNYQTDGYYFVTICTYMRQPFFGEIKNGKMVLSDMGQICHDEWIKTTAIRKNIILDAFIIMPDHSHFLVVIKNDGNDGQGNDERNNVSRSVETRLSLVSTRPVFP